MHPAFDPNYKPVCAVYGLGESGLSTMRVLKKLALAACCWDDDADKRHRAIAEGFMLNDFSRKGIPDQVQTLLFSPGVPWNGQDRDHPAAKLATLAKSQNVRICCDVEWFLRFGRQTEPKLFAPEAALFAVTGTNGKTSVVSWLEGFIREQGYRARAIGNNGVPVMDDHQEPDCLIFELSSYQLDLLDARAFDRVMILNISPDHLERYGSLEAYRDSKRRILQTLREDNLGAVIGVDDPWCEEIAQQAEEEGIAVLRFSSERILEGHVYLDQGQLIDHRGVVPRVVLDVSQDRLLDNLQHMRSLTAVYAFLCVYLDQEETQHDWYTHRAFSDYAQKVVRKISFDHRQNPVAWQDQTLFVDDSKATNPIAAADALRQFRHIHWIAGGQSKQGGFADLQGCFADVEAIYLFGAAEQELADFLAQKNLPHRVPVHRCKTLPEVMERIAEAREQDPRAMRTVLFSPACASFDQFANYVERGRAFTLLAHQSGATRVENTPDEQALQIIKNLRRGLLDTVGKDAVLEETSSRSQEEVLPPADTDLVARPAVRRQAPKVLKDEPTLVQRAPERSGRMFNMTEFLGHWVSNVDMLSIMIILVVFGFSLTVQAIIAVHVGDISFWRQSIVGLSGFVGMIVMSMLGRELMLKLVFVSFFLALCAMGWTLVGGEQIKGASRWITIPMINYSLQPIEVFKIASVAITALVLGHACFMGYRRLLRVVLGGGCILATVPLPFVQPDIGQSILLLVALGGVLVLACDRYAVWMVIVLAVVVLLMLVGGYFKFSHFVVRINDFWVRNYDPTDQVGVAQYTVENAKWFLGGADMFKFPWYRLSDIESDFVFTMMLQEFGILLSLIPVILMVLVLMRAVYLLWDNQDITWRLWNWGLVILLSGQIFINLGSATAFIPPKGITLPLLSYGGSSVLGVFFALGMLLFLSRRGSNNLEMETHTERKIVP